MAMNRDTRAVIADTGAPRHGRRRTADASAIPAANQLTPRNISLLEP